MVKDDRHFEFGFDKPLTLQNALAEEKFGRQVFAGTAADIFRRINAQSGLVMSIEGAWGSGKTSTLALIQAFLVAQQPKPIVVHFNPWLVGDRDALLRQFLAKVSTAVKLIDHSASSKNVARELNAYARVFDMVKLIPGAEPWASLVKTVVESTGGAVSGVSEYKAPDLDEQKRKLEDALCAFGRPIIVMIDDVDRLFPLEVYEIVRIIKAVGDLPNVGYVIAWDPSYVCDALRAAQVPQAEQYLDKVVQVRLPVPVLSNPVRQRLIDEAFARLNPLARKGYFPHESERLSWVYYSGLRDILEQPRDFARIFNTAALIEPALRGEIVLADIVALAALIVKAPRLYELMRKHPEWFVGKLHSHSGLPTEDEDLVKEGDGARDDAIRQSGSPTAVRKLTTFLFPLIARGSGEIALSRGIENEGHISNPRRFIVALQHQPSDHDVSIVSARRYLENADERERIAGTLSDQNCLEFVECLADLVESNGVDGVDRIEELCVQIARLADTAPFITRSTDRTKMFTLSAAVVALQAIGSIVKAARYQAPAICEKIISDPMSLSVAMELFANNFLFSRERDAVLKCDPSGKEQLTNALIPNILAAAPAGRVLETCNPGSFLSRLAKIDTRVCAEVFAALRVKDESLDTFALAILGHTYDSTKGQRYSLPDDCSGLEAYCSLPELKKIAAERMASSSLAPSVRAAWRSVLEERSIYGADGTYADD